MNTTMQQAGPSGGRDGPLQLGMDDRALPGGGQDEWGQQRSRSAKGTAERLTSALGRLSLGLGLPGVVIPGGFARLIGIENDGSNRAIARFVGLREIASGIGILTTRRPVGWVLMRVAGDVMDISLLLATLRSDEARRRGRVATALAAVLGITAVDVLCAVQLSQTSGSAMGRGGKGHAVDVRKAITVKATPEEAYRFWRDFQNLPRFMTHLQSVQVSSERRSHWKAEGPAGKTVEDRPNELIAWRSLPGADVDNSGRVRFQPAPGGRGTEIEVELGYDPPGGKLGRTMAKLFGKEPGQEVAGDLRRLKQVLETGEVIRSDATIAGTGFPQRPAQPPEGGQQLAAAR